MSVSTLTDRPLLSIAIPTYNRAEFLAELLECILPAVTNEPRLELLISDNASTDGTPEMIEGFRARGMPCRVERNAENMGPDENFLRCLELARGKYVWILGDDDLIAPQGVEKLMSLLDVDDEYDLVYLSSFGFTSGQQPHFIHDKLGRFGEVVTNGQYFLEKVNALIGLISVNIVNKDRLNATPHPPIATLNNSNLLQVGWLFPVIHRQCRILYIWDRLVAYRMFNAGGWGPCEVFGLRLDAIARRYFAAEPALAESLMNGVLRYWLSDSVMVMRRGQYDTMFAEDFVHHLQPLFSRNWRFWWFIYPISVLPLSLAIPVHRVNQLLNKLTRAVQAVARHIFASGKLVRPL